MLARVVISGAAGLALFFANTAFSSSHGVVEKAGPAFSWLKKLDRVELAAVDGHCQQEAAALQANASAAHRHQLELIIGGDMATPRQFPCAVALGRASTYVATCGATLISPRHLLTAAHCVMSDMSKEEADVNRTVWLGGVCYYASLEDGCPTPDMFEVEMELAVKVYYSRTVRDRRTVDEKKLHDPADLALIQLRSPIDHHLLESGRVGYACLPPPPSRPLPESLCSIGWGRHSKAVDGEDPYSAHLRFVRLLTRPRSEWSPGIHFIGQCETSRAYPRFCQYPPGRAQASVYRGDSGSGTLAIIADDDTPPHHGDVLYGVHASGFTYSYSVNASDWSEPYVRRTLGSSVSVQYHLDDLCYYLHLGCGVEGVTGVATTLPLSSFYLKCKRSEMPSIVPFALLSDDKPLTGRVTPEQAVAALVDAGSGNGKEQVICVAVAISPRHLVTTRACIITDKYLRDWRGQTTGGGIIAVASCDTNPPSQQCANRVEFIAWQRAVTTQSPGQQAVAGSELAIVQLTTTDNRFERN